MHVKRRRFLGPKIRHPPSWSRGRCRVAEAEAAGEGESSLLVKVVRANRQSSVAKPLSFHLSPSLLHLVLFHSHLSHCQRHMCHRETSTASGRPLPVCGRSCLTQTPTLRSRLSHALTPILSHAATHRRAACLKRGQGPHVAAIATESRPSQPSTTSKTHLKSIADYFRAAS